MDTNNEKQTVLKPLTDVQRANKLKEFRRKNSGKSLSDLRKKMLTRQKLMVQIASETQETAEEQKPTEEKPKKKRRSKKVEQEGK